MEEEVRTYKFALEYALVTNLYLLEGGQDATEVFFGLHLYEVLQRPQYKRLEVGVIKGEQPRLHGRIQGQLSEVPYAEPSWLSKGYYSPYFKEVRLPRLSRFRGLPKALNRSSLFPQSHKKLQEAMRDFVDDVLYPEAQVRPHL